MYICILYIHIHRYIERDCNNHTPVTIATLAMAEVLEETRHRRPGTLDSGPVKDTRCDPLIRPQLAGNSHFLMAIFWVNVSFFFGKC